MVFHRLRRAWMAAACLCGALLAACGGGQVESQLAPKRIVAFGDGMADLGQTGARYTVNDGSVNIWTQQLAWRYGLTLTTSGSGGTSFATGNARIAATPDAAGSFVTPTVTQQIDGFLGGAGFGADDLVVVSAGVADIVAEVMASGAAAEAAVTQAGTQLGVQVRRLVNAGARHVVVVGPYNLGRSPWAHGSGQRPLLERLATRFNDALLVSIVDLGQHVLFVDAAFYYNLVTAAPPGYGLDNATEAACTSFDPGVGIGIGAGQVNSALCTPATLRGDANSNRWLFADAVYPTPVGHRLFGDYAYERIRQRW